MYKVTVNKFEIMEEKYVNRHYLALVDNFEELSVLNYGTTDHEIIGASKVDASYYDRGCELENVESICAIRYMILSVDDKGKLKKVPATVYLPALTTKEAEKVFWEEYMKDSVCDVLICKNEKTDLIPIEK